MLQITNVRNQREYSVDLTLAIKCVDWPKEAVEWFIRPRNGNLLSFLLFRSKTNNRLFLKSSFI